MDQASTRTAPHLTGRAMRTLARVAVVLLSSIGLLVLVVTFTPVVSWWGGKLGGSWQNPKGEVLIVLGGGALGPDLIGISSYWRCVYAHLVYQEGGFERVVISGEGVAEPMRDFLVHRGIPPAIITTETQSTSTHENAVNVSKLLTGTDGRKVLVSSDYHMFRASRAFRKAGMPVLERPYPDVRKRAARLLGRWPAFLDLLDETAKIGYYWLRGWI